MTGIAALLLQPVMPMQIAALPPAASTVVDQVSDVLRRNEVDGVINVVTKPPTLSIASLSGVSRGDRVALLRLVREGRLDIARSGAISSLPGPEIPDESVPDVPMGLVHGGYPNPNIGGVRYHAGYPGNRYQCTSGFPVVNGFGYFTATAGHCGPAVNTPVLSTNGEPNPSSAAAYDHIRLTTWGSGAPLADAAIFANSAPMAAIRVSPSQARVIRGGEDPYLLEGNICFRGATSAAEKCGNVNKVNQVVTVSGRTFSAFCIYDLAALPGDSGAPIYRKLGSGDARMRGVISFRWDTNGDGHYDSACGSPLSKVLSATNSSLVTS